MKLTARDFKKYVEDTSEVTGAIQRFIKAYNGHNATVTNIGYSSKGLMVSYEYFSQGNGYKNNDSIFIPFDKINAPHEEIVEYREKVIEAEKKAEDERIRKRLAEEEMRTVEREKKMLSELIEKYGIPETKTKKK